jgi:hypothetical protein
LRIAKSERGFGGVGAVRESGREEHHEAREEPEEASMCVGRGMESLRGGEVRRGDGAGGAKSPRNLGAGFHIDSIIYL